MASSSTRCRLPLTIRFCASLADTSPVSATVIPGCAAGLAARDWMRALAASSSLPVAGAAGWRVLTDTSTEWRSAEVVVPTRSPAAAIARATSLTAAAKPGSVLTWALLCR